MNLTAKEQIENHLLNAMKDIDRAIAEIVSLDKPEYSDSIQKLIGAKQALKYQLNKHFDKLAK